ncbi:PucR family transcriptional regulator [Peribacillus saganii]|uniref:PucR family transcriptional regulator n=1 Tax=Peribacillus saganii TaxID=2303992 RepID=A0A372LSZ5_9BACI|nr:PucR family transcriptional regulator [Peribacillus saganii]RFU70674.1 PucR family transcriptional regulator [Peribacillus saganii]
MNNAGITLRELLRLPVLKDAKVISGEQGLDRAVRFIDIMEVPDVKEWLREGELLLTTAYAIRHDPSLLPELVELLEKAGAAALAIKPERFLQDMPAEMIRLSNDYNLPIIEIPSGIAYMDITHAVMEQIIDKQASMLRRSDEVYKTLTTLVLENRGIQAVADTVSKLLKSPIRVIDKIGETIVSSPSNVPLTATSDNRNWDIAVDKQFVGKLIIEKGHLDELELICVEHARLVFSLELMRRKTALDTEIRLRGDFIEELLTGLPLSKQELVNKGRQFGLTPDCVWQTAIIEADQLFFDNSSEYIMELGELIEQESNKRGIKSHLHKQGNRIVLLLASHNREDIIGEQVYRTKHLESWSLILNPIISGWKGFRIGYGGECKLWAVQKSYLEAKKAIRIGSRLDKNKQIFTFEEIEMFQLLIDASEYINMDEFVEKKIGKICDYDTKHNTDLVTTFYYYLASGGSLLDTAKHLYIHRNSVKYRIDRIKEIADVDLENFQERFVYYFSIMYHLIKKTK